MAKINLYDVAPSILGGFDTGLQEYVLTKPIPLSTLEADLRTSQICNQQVQA